MLTLVARRHEAADRVGLVEADRDRLLALRDRAGTVLTSCDACTNWSDTSGVPVKMSVAATLPL